jgi:hypothetical protein
MVDLKKLTPLALDPDLKTDGLFIPFNDSWELMQYTEQRDSNKKEYYEGDIVYTVYGNMEVVWNDDKLCWQMENEKHCFDGHEIDWTTQTIIGNIHQNPELLNN